MTTPDQIVAKVGVSSTTHAAVVFWWRPWEGTQSWARCYRCKNAMPRDDRWWATLWHALCTRHRPDHDNDGALRSLLRLAGESQREVQG